MMINKKYKTLLDYENNDGIDYYIITGGRGAGKSFAISLFAILYLIKTGSLVYSRYTKSAVSSTILDDLKMRVEDLNMNSLFDIQANLVRYGENSILFKGLKAQSNLDDANNKGVNKYNVLMIDEAQDFRDEKAFDRADLSFRSTRNKAFTILVLNPDNKEHWIYKRFFEKNNIPDGYNGIVGNTCFIHTTYLENTENLDAKFLRLANEWKQDDTDYYNNIFLGYWAEISEFIVFQRKQLKYTQAPPIEYDYKYAYIDVADEGTDYLAMVMCGVKDNIPYLYDVYYTKKGIDYTLPDVVQIIKQEHFDFIRIEANNMGRGFYRQVLKELGDTDTTIQAITNTTNKIVRIINASYSIKKRMIFLDTSIQSKMYVQFMDDLHKFSSDGKNNNDDGADALSGIWTLINSLIYKYENN